MAKGRPVKAAPQGEHARTHPTRKTVAPRGENASAKGRVKPPAKPAIHDIIVRGTTGPRKPATPIVTEHTRGQAHAAPDTRSEGAKRGLPEDYGVAEKNLTNPKDLAHLHAIARSHPSVPLPISLKVGKAALDFTDLLTGGAVSGAEDLVRNPIGHLSPAPARNAQGGLLPLDKQPIQGGVFPFGITGRAGAGAKAAAKGIGSILGRGGGEAVPQGLRGLPATRAEQGQALAMVRAETAKGSPPVRGTQSVAPLPPKNEVAAGLRGAKGVRTRQEAGYSVERAKRAAAAEAAMRANPGIEGHRAALVALRGELPKINFGGFKELTPDALDALAKHIHEHPHLMPFQKITAVRALENATQGKVPTNSEIRLLTNIFGRDTAQSLAKIHTIPDHIKNVILETLNVPRSIMASFDLSAPFRQGLMAGARHPAIFAKNFKPMVKSFAKQGASEAVDAEIRSRPTFHMMEGAKLAITDLTDDLSRREENLFGYKMAEKIPVAGHGIRASGRAYNAFLNKMRADVFDHLIKGFEEQGVNIHDQHFLEGLGKYINASTGRGDLGSFTQAAPYLNTVFFSPRLLASRLNFLNPVFYAKLPAPVRKEALRSALQLTGLVSTTLGLAAFAGAKVNRDPRNADFAKIRLGNTRLDILGGFQQPIRLLSQLEQGKVISSTTGDPLTLGPGIGGLSRRDIVQRFFEGKLAPTPSIINDWFKGTDFQGQPFSWKKEAFSHMTPLLMQDVGDLYGEQGGGPKGVGAAIGGYGIGGLGIGVQTYAAPNLAKKAIEARANNKQIPNAGEIAAAFSKYGHPLPDAKKQTLITARRRQTAAAVRLATLGIKTGEPHYQRRAFEAELKLAREKRWASLEAIDADLANLDKMSDTAIKRKRSQLRQYAFLTGETRDALKALHQIEEQANGG